MWKKQMLHSHSSKKKKKKSARRRRSSVFKAVKGETCRSRIPCTPAVASVQEFPLPPLPSNVSLEILASEIRQARERKGIPDQTGRCQPPSFTDSAVLESWVKCTREAGRVTEFSEVARLQINTQKLIRCVYVC